ncbi:MAG: hypothetical protein K0S09_1180 [Sphingobacteriaceae bacterium]|nr:hypothetical protein [Sphingobacteriaceae bacterium]
MLVAIWIGTSVFLFKTMPLITLALGVGAIFSFYEKYLLSQGRGIPSAFKRLKIVGYFVAAAVIAFLFYDVL